MDCVVDDYGTADPPLLDVHLRPDRATPAPAPAAVLVHGCRMWTGSRVDVVDHARWLA